LLDTKIQGKKQYSSWFHYAFEEPVFIPGGIECYLWIIGATGDTYQQISKSQCSPVVDAAKSPPSQSWDFYGILKWLREKMEDAIPPRNLTIVKSLSFDHILSTQ